MTTLDVLKVARVVPASPERVFRAWTTPEEIKRWFGRPEGFEIATVEQDVRVGGRLRIEISPPGATPGSSPSIVGVYRVVSPPERLVFSFSWDKPVWDVMDTGETVVSIDFRAVDGGTEIVIVHERLRDAAKIGFHSLGWTDALARLERHLGSASAD